MPRLPHLRSLTSRLATATPSPTPYRTPFAACRAISTTRVTRGKNTEWVRGKLWKDEAPGSEDPYTQRAEPEDPSNLPEEALRFQHRPDKTPRPVLESRLTLPPKRTEAVSEKEVNSSDPTYVPATEAEGLEEIGALNTWWDQDGHWGEESEFRGFGSPEKIVDKDVVEVYLRQAVVEALALRETGAFPEWATKKWREGPRSELDQVLAVDVQVQGSQPLLKGDVSAIVQNLTAEDNEMKTTEKIFPEEAREMVKTWDASWKNIVLDDQLKFALRKRLYQLTGTLIADSKLGAACTVKHVLTLAVKKPQAKKLAELLETRSDIQNLGNVKVHSRKIGPIEKETALGRWKVIEEELTKRGLPITGTGGMSRNKERDWISGKI
ncbi:Ribosomal protein L50, mitochondria [Metarhizium rileyi]|uniref:Large ribosomal subunit protein mL50 n=1 Tax=Metarhizium rileyi (strain RCEF 4871) TaxID=1649241 RepID=A0A167JQX6_METRR|nr:Ribosomal protein L50, mitochondria [Metarhizium rileyi RCEF 4871]